MTLTPHGEFALAAGLLPLVLDQSANLLPSTQTMALRTISANKNLNFQNKSFECLQDGNY